MWSSLSRFARLKDGARMLETLHEYLGVGFTNTIRETLASVYLDMALISRQDGRRAETAKCVISHLLNTGRHLPDSWRLIAGLATYILIGSSYKILSRANSQGNNR